MLIEHLIYSFAIAILFGMVYRGFTGRELSWIIVLSAFIPDVDIIFALIFGRHFAHGDFHNIVFLLLYALSMAFLLNQIGFKFADVFIFSAIGFGAHLIEDALVFSDGESYSYLWPLTSRRYGFGHYYPNFYYIADAEVLKWAFIFLGIAIVLRTLYERKNWLGEMMDLSH
jgi:hypothetical protein